MRLLVVVGAFGAVGATYSPENAVSCANMIDPKEALRCRKNHAGNLQCRDKTRCTIGSGDLHTIKLQNPKLELGVNYIQDVHICSDDDTSYRTGHQCHDFPYYMGGYPLGPLLWDQEWEQYDCVSNSTSYCSEWHMYEYSSYEYEIGIYTCQETKNSTFGHTYCSKFASVQRETAKCGKGEGCDPNCDTPTYCVRQCCNDDDGCYDCSYTPHSELEYSVANVIAVNEYGAWLQWTQEEYDENNYYFREYENYNCTLLSPNQRYCHSWVGDIDSEAEFEIASCTCIDEADSLSTYCKKWSCFETGAPYFYPSLPWPVICFGLTFLTMVFRHMELTERGKEGVSYLYYLCFFGWQQIPPFGLSVAVLYLGGVPAWCIWFGVHVLIMWWEWNYVRTKFTPTSHQAVALQVPEAYAEAQLVTEAYPEDLAEVELVKM